MKQSKKGFALVSAIVITIVLFILTAGLITAAMMSMNITSKNIDQRQAYLNAKSALSFSESYYLSQLQLPDQAQYLAFSADNGTVSGGAAVSAALDGSGNEVPPDKQTYVRAEYDMGAQSFTLTATARFHSPQLDGAQTLQLSCSYDVGYDADGRITTVVKRIETKDKSRYVTIHVKPYDDLFQPYLYTWGYGTGQEEQQPNVEKDNTLFSGEWLDSTKTDAQGNLLYAGPQGAMTRESAGSSGGWNGWYCTEIELRDDNVNYINAIIAKKGALRGTSNTTTQSHEMFQLPVPENAGERQDVYITLNSEELRDFRWDTMTFPGCEAPDSFTEYLTSYVKAEYTTVHVRRAQPDGTTAEELKAPRLVVEEFTDENLITDTPDTKTKFSGGDMIYEGCGWYRLNVPTQKAFGFSIEDERRTVFQTEKEERGGVDNHIWVALPAQGTSNAPAVKTTEKEINTYFRDSLQESDAGSYSTVYVKGLALSRENVNDVPTVLMNYYAKGAQEDIPLPPSTGKYLLTLKYNDRDGTVDKKMYNANEKIVLPKLSRPGYVFKGWATSSTKTQPDYQPGAEYTVKGSAYLYGVWEMTEYFVTYDANGGQNPPATQSFTVEAPAKFAGQGAMTNGSYAFMGWSRTKTGDAEYKPGDTIDPSVMGSGTSITLFAVWNDKCFITYDANGGSGTLPAKQSVKIGGTFSVGSGSALSRQDHQFLGWSADKNASAAQYTPGQNVKPQSNMTLYAVWKRTSVTVTFRNEKNWTTVNAYVWKNGGAIYKGWPGEKMTDTGKTSEGFKLYSYKIPLGAGYDYIIFNNGSGDQTDDLVLNAQTPAYYYSNTSGRGSFVMTTEFRSVYLTDNRDWGTPYIYLWKDRVNNGTWPGKAMNFARKNEYNQNIYEYCYPAGKYDTAIFNNNSARTVDVDISKDKDGQGYYMTDPDAASGGSYNVDKFNYTPANVNASPALMGTAGQSPALTGALIGGAGTLTGFGEQSAGNNPFSRQGSFGIQNLFTAAAGWLQTFFAPPQLQSVQPAQAENTPQSLLAYYGGAFYLRTAADAPEKQANPDSVYLAGTFNGWAYDNIDYKMQAEDGSGFEKFTHTVTLPGGSSYKFNIFDDGVTYGKKGAIFSGEMAQNNALEADGEEMSLQTIGSISDRIDVAFTYERIPQADGSTKYILKATQKTAVTKEKINIYIGVATGIVTEKGSSWKTPDVECRDKNGSVTNYIHSIALSSDTTTVKYGEGEGAFYMSSAQIPSVSNNIRLSVNTTALAADFLSDAKEDHLYLLYQTGGRYVLADNGEYSPTMDDILDFDGEWTEENVKIASDRGSKVQYYNTFMRKYKNAQDEIVPVENFKAYYGDEKYRAGNSAACYLNDWYTYKIKTGQNGSYTVQFTGLNGKQNTYDESTSPDKTALGAAAATVNSLRGDTWITLNTDSVKGGVMDDLSVYTYDPEENYAGKETTVYLDDNAGWGGKDHSEPVYVYYWGVKTMAWPGKEMKYDEKIGKYSATIPSSSPFIVFNNGVPMDDEACKRSGIETLQSDWTLTCYDNEKGEWVSYVHPRVALYKAINDGVAALNRSTIQKSTNKNDGMLSFTVLQDLIVDARTAYDNYSFNEYAGYTGQLNSYVDEINAFNDVLREARIYLDGYPEHLYYDSSLSYSPESIANLKDAHNSAMAVFSLSGRSTAAGQIRSKASLLRKAIDSMDLQLSGGGDMKSGQAVVVLVNQDENWSHPGDKESGIGGGLVDFGTYTETQGGILEGEVTKTGQRLTQYNSQGYYLYFIDIPQGSDSAWAKFRSIYSGGGESSKKSGIKAGEVWVYNNKTGTWRENTAGDFQVVGTSTISGKKGESRLFTAKKEKGDFKLYFSYDTTVTYDGAQYVIYAGVYQIKNDAFPDGIDLFTPQAKAFFTNPESFRFDVDPPSDGEWDFPVPVSSSIDWDWTDDNGNLTGGSRDATGTVNLLVGGKLGADSSGAGPVTPEKSPKRVYFYDRDGKWASAGGYWLNMEGTNYHVEMTKSAVSGYYYFDVPGNVDCSTIKFDFHGGKSNSDYPYEVDTNYRKITAGVDIDAAEPLLFTLGGDMYNGTKNYTGTWSLLTSTDPGFALDKAEEETPGSGITGADIDAAGQHNLITGGAGTLPANHNAVYTAGKINFRWVQGNVLDMTGSQITLNSEKITIAVSDLSVVKKLGDADYNGGFYVGDDSRGFDEQTVTFYTDVNVIIYNSNRTVNKQESFTIKNGRYKINGKVNLFDFKKEMESPNGSGNVASVDSGRFSGRVYGHGD